jgi:BASS family bile acid:Na+ symporter
VVTVPAYLGLAIAHFDAAGLSDDVSMVGVVARVFAITIVPLAIGMWIRSRSPERVVALEPRVKRVALVAFVLVVIGAVASEFDLLVDNFSSVAAAALCLNVAAMTVSFTIARVARLDDRQATAIAMELGIHNSTLAITVASAISTELAIPAAVYSAFMFFTAGGLARVMSRRNAAVATA